MYINHNDTKAFVYRHEFPGEKMTCCRCGESAIFNVGKYMYSREMLVGRVPITNFAERFQRAHNREGMVAVHTKCLTEEEGATYRREHWSDMPSVRRKSNAQRMLDDYFAPINVEGYNPGCTCGTTIIPFCDPCMTAMRHRGSKRDDFANLGPSEMQFLLDLIDYRLKKSKEGCSNES